MKANILRPLLMLTLLLAIAGIPACAQSAASPKREAKKNLVVKEWQTKAGSKRKFLDHQTSYDGQGRKYEEIEYASYGQKYRIVYEYEGASTRCSREVEYDDKNHVVVIRKYEYNDDGTRKRQYNYYPNGKLASTKDFEYTR